MNVIVTGGAGFIGSNFVRYAVKELNWSVLVYDKLTYAGRIENLKDLLDRIIFVRGDIIDEEKFKNTIRKFEPDIAINFAAETHVDRSINNPVPFIRTNILGVFTILEVLRKYDNVALLHVSTDEVYGDLQHADIKADETFPLNPSNPYSASKASGDMLILAYGRTYGLNYWIVRPSNNYGPYQYPEKLVPKTIIRLLHNRPAVVYGDGEQIRSWIYVEDCVRAIVTVIERGAKRETYNICSDILKNVKEVVATIAKLMGKDPLVDIAYSKPRPGEDRRYSMNCNKIMNLGWKPRFNFEEGLLKTIEWYVNNEWWWRPVLESDHQYVLAETPW